MWIGTRMGLYQIDKESGIYQYVDLPIESPYICALYQRDDGILYIGTRGAGLLVYDINKKEVYPPISYRKLCTDFRQYLYNSSAPRREFAHGYRKRNHHLLTQSTLFPQLDKGTRLDEHQF